MYRNKIYFGIVSLLVIFGAFFIVSPFFEKDELQIPSFIYKNQIDSPFLDEVTGKIHLTLQPIDKSLPQGLYFYDFASKTLERPSYKEGATLVTSKNSPTKDSEFAFVARDLNGNSQIFTADFSSYGVRQITFSDTRLKLLPEWSKDGKGIAFSVRDTNLGADSTLPENWKVYITKLDGQEAFISNGIYPKWSPDGKYVLFMKNDGLYTYNLKGSELNGKAWWVDNDLIHTGVKLDVSPDGKMMALSNVDKGEVALIEILSWSPFKVGEKNILRSSSFWPTFSDDGLYLAVQEVDNAFDLSNPRLVVYDLSTLEHEIVLSLNGYIQEAMFISDWQK